MPSILLTNAVFLSIDSATVSGVAISVPEVIGNRVRDYEIASFGLAKSPADRRAWVHDAAAIAKEERLPLIVASECWTRHGLSNRAYESLCETWGRWLEWLEVEASDAHVVRALPDTWRNAVFGKRRAKERDAAKDQAVRYVELALRLPTLQHDIAEALCLRVWASRADEVHGLLAPKKPKKKRR